MVKPRSLCYNAATVIKRGLSMTRRGAVVLSIIIFSLWAAWPATAAQEAKIDVILLVDTSDSLTDELQALCRAVEGMAADVNRQGVAMNYVVLGVARTSDCADERVTHLIPESQVENRRDWGPAVTDLARHYKWRTGAMRLIIPVSDAGPLRGDPVNEGDERAIQEAIQAAQANEVIVSPVLGTGFNRMVMPLAFKLAWETGGQVFQTQEPDNDLGDGLQALIAEVTGEIRVSNTLTRAIPTPRDIVLSGRAIGTNLVLALLMTLVLGVASAVLNNTLQDKRAAFEATRLGQWVAATVDLGSRFDRWLAPGEGAQRPARARRLPTVARWASFLILVTFLGVFLQPGLSPLSWRGLGLWLGMLLALALMGLLYDGSQYVLARRSGASPALRLRPGTPLATLLSVMLSRVAGFLPGYFYGRLIVCTVPLESTEADLPLQRRAQIVLLGLGLVGAAGLSLWVLTLPTSLLLDWIEGLGLPALMNDASTGLLGALQGLFLLGFFLAWQTLLFELLPFPATGGGVIYRRNRLTWALTVCAVLFVLLHVLLNPSGTTGDLLDSSGLLLLLLAFLLYSTLAVGLWLYLALRTGGEVVTDWRRGQRTTVMALALIVIWVLGACWGLVLLLGRLF